MALEDIRKRIDEIDQEIVALLCERFALMPAVAACKKEHGLAIEQPQREEQLLQEKVQLFKEKGFEDDAFVRELFRLIMRKAKQIQADTD
ncbi:hypothetical protein D6774_01860 [Candidatus Woesearchaeota archaeon]|nr:MAG: hypothetical protein D6774_01860 [Candidatus Woesearchaeota archaeon]